MTINRWAVMPFFESINRLFPLWAIAFSVVAMVQPQWFTSMAPAIQGLLSLVMFTMGLTLSHHDFLRVARSPKPIVVGMVLQFTVMPLAALGIATLLQFDDMLTAGMVLVGATAGGTASNVITWLAGGRVALSVSMTLVSTLMSVALTPLLTWWLLGTGISVDLWGMLLSILKMVMVPVVLGILLHPLLAPQIRRWESALAFVAMAVIVLIIAIVVALNADKLLSLGPIIALAVIAHNGFGLSVAYASARGLGFDRRTARTLAIEVGMQNSGLAVALANQFFTATAALPGALFSIWHNISGSLLAGYWKRRPVDEETDSQ